MAILTGTSTISLANTVLYEARRRGVKVNPMKLQRLLYLLCAAYAQETGNFLFSENFQCWGYGPVLPSVYWKFSCYRTRPIADYGKDALGHAEAMDLRSNIALARVFYPVMEYYLPYTAKELCEITRQRGGAWYKSFQAGKDEIGYDDVLTDPCVRAVMPAHA